MTVQHILQGQTATFTASLRDQSFTVANNGGQYATVWGSAKGLPFITSMGPTPSREIVGPLNAGDQFNVRADIGEILVEYDILDVSAASDQVPRVLTGSTYTLVAADDKGTLIAPDGMTITFSPALSMIYGAILRNAGAGVVTLSPGDGTVLLNGQSASTTRTRDTNPSGFAITPQGAKRWGVTNGASAITFANVGGAPADNTALAAALAAKADVGSVPGILLRTNGPRQGAAVGSAQIFSGANPSQVALPAGTLATVSQRLSTKFFATKDGPTNALVVLLYLGAAGTISDQTIGTTGALPVATVNFDGEYVIQRLTSTSIQCMLRLGSPGASSVQVGTFTVANLDTNDLILSLGVKTGTTDKPTLVDLQVELK